MKDVYSRYYQFAFILAIWLLTTVYLGPVIYILVPITLLLLAYKQRYLELLIGFFFFLILSDSLQAGLLPSKNIRPIYLIFLTFIYFFNQKEFKPFNKFAISFYPFFLLAVILIFRSEIIDTALQKTISYILVFLIIPNYISKLLRDDKKEFLKVLLVFGISVLLVSLALIVLNPDVAFIKGRYRGVFGNPNGMGMFCVLFVMLAHVILYYYPKLFSKTESIFFYAIIGLSVLMTGSRNSVLSVAIFVVFLRFYKISPALGFILFLSFLVSYNIILSRYIEIIILLGLEEYFRIETLVTMSNRMEAYHYAWIKIQDNFFFGRGFAHDEFVFRNFHIETGVIGRVANVHNVFLGFWLNTGILGVILYFRAFLLKFIEAAKNSYLAFPIMFAITFSINFEAWLLASINPFTIQFIIILTLLTDKNFIHKKTIEQ